MRRFLLLLAVLRASASCSVPPAPAAAAPTTEAAHANSPKRKILVVLSSESVLPLQGLSIDRKSAFIGNFLENADVSG